ncbi:MAG: hypothetical protein ACKVQB_13440 [Bacteroidia bacterium]
MVIQKMYVGSFILNFLILFFLIFLNATPVHSNDRTEDYLNSKPEGNSLNKKSWEKLKDDYKYKTPKIDAKKKQKKNSENKVSWQGGSFLMKALAYAAIFVLLLGVIYLLARFVFLGHKNFKNKAIQYDVNAEPEDINDMDTDPLLSVALKNEDYRLATRLRFLALLQILNLNTKIQWKRDRTNQHYSQQLWGTSIYISFRQLCLIYESVWYGDYQINSEGYQIVNEKFEHIILQLNTKTYV